MSEKPTWVGLFGSDPDFGKGHEPECNHGYGDCCCEAIRDAYQRGREDASNAALAAFMDCYGEVDATRMQIVAAALLDMPAAARGGAERSE